MNKYLRYPVNWVAITTYFSSSHLALDYGWNSSKGGKNAPIYSVGDGKVIDIGKSTGTGNAGNYVWIKYELEDYDILTRSAHLKDGSIKVKVGQKVTRGQQIANMGGTFGYAEHLHHDVWKVPKGYKFNWNDRKKYSVNPVDYLVLFEDQSHGESAKGVMSLLGTSKQAKRDTTKNQIEVVGYKLRVRKGAGTNQTILGYCDFGVYTYIETKTSNGYTWYNLGFGWVAGVSGDVKVYKKQIPDDRKPIEEEHLPEAEKLIEELNTQLEAQKSQNEQLLKQIDELHQQIENHSNLKEFVAKTSGYYYIKLEAGQKLYRD